MSGNPIRIAIDVTMDYRLGSDWQPDSDGVILLVIEAAETDGQTVLESRLTIPGATLDRSYQAGDSQGSDWGGGGDWSGGGVGQRLWVRAGNHQMTLHYHATVTVTRTAVDLASLRAQGNLPDAVLPYLRPSRFCQSDQFTDFTAQRFGHLAGGAKVAAIRDWVAAEIAYVPASSHSATTAIETFHAQTGVCRDFVHLLCCLVRAAGLPARYVSVYGPDVTPPDFHAVAQVWLDGAWHLVDATGMCRADGLVIIGVGRDAADIAFMETQQWVEMVSQSVTVTRLP